MNITVSVQIPSHWQQFRPMKEQEIFLRQATNIVNETQKCSVLSLL